MCVHLFKINYKLNKLKIFISLSVTFVAFAVNKLPSMTVCRAASWWSRTGPVSGLPGRRRPDPERHCSSLLVCRSAAGELTASHRLYHLRRRLAGTCTAPSPRPRSDSATAVELSCDYRRQVPFVSIITGRRLTKWVCHILSNTILSAVPSYELRLTHVNEVARSNGNHQ